MSFEDVYERSFPSLFRYLHRYTGDADAATDLAQEAFMRLLSARVPEADARAWLFRVATNLARDRSRARTRRLRLLDRWLGGGEDAVAADEGIERREAVERVRLALDALDGRDRRMLLMREEGFTYREIAEAVGVAPGSVGTLIARAVERFREVYAND